MDCKIRLSATLIILLTLLFPVFCVITNGNPIPVYPEPETVYSGSGDFSSLDMTWITIVFIIDFFIDILIIYSGIYLLDRFDMIKDRDVLDFPKRTLLLPVLFISLVGLFSELIFGAWMGGLLLALLFIFLSFVFVSKYFLKFGWANSFRMSMFALLINIIVWIVVFTI